MDADTSKGKKPQGKSGGPPKTEAKKTIND
jgi:hypothetical protein